MLLRLENILNITLYITKRLLEQAIIGQRISKWKTFVIFEELKSMSNVSFGLRRLLELNVSIRNCWYR